MKLAAKILLLPILFLISWNAGAQVEWNEPEVVPEKLVRQNRRVLRFSGSTEPGSQLRVRKGRLKMYLDSGKTRWADIPQKNRIQFPVVADGNGEFTFDLYLPTVAVEIPMEIFTGGKWVPYKLNFRVPDEGSANDFQAVEESFQANDDPVEQLEERNYYNRKKDRGQYIRNRDGDIEKSPVEVYGGAGLTYFTTTVKTGAGTGVDLSEGTIVIPSWRLGANWNYSSDWRFLMALRSTSGSVDATSTATMTVTGTDFNWLEFQMGAQYFLKSLKMGSGRMGIDFGFGLQSVPFFRVRDSVLNNATFFDNEIYALHIGMIYETDKDREWPYEMYARYFYPLTTGDSFDVESSFPMMFEFGGGARKQVTPGLALGVYGQLEWFSMDVKYLNTGTSEFSLMQFTVDARLIANF